MYEVCQKYITRENVRQQGNELEFQKKKKRKEMSLNRSEINNRT